MVRLEEATGSLEGLDRRAVLAILVRSAFSPSLPCEADLVLADCTFFLLFVRLQRKQPFLPIATVLGPIPPPHPLRRPPPTSPCQLSHVPYRRVRTGSIERLANARCRKWTERRDQAGRAVDGEGDELGDFEEAHEFEEEEQAGDAAEYGVSRLGRSRAGWKRRRGEEGTDARTRYVW